MLRAHKAEIYRHRTSSLLFKPTMNRVLRGLSSGSLPEADDREPASRSNINATPRYQDYPELIYDEALRQYIPNPVTEWEEGLKQRRARGLQPEQRIISWDIGPKPTPTPPAPLRLPDHFESPYYDMTLGHDHPSPEYPYGRLRSACFATPMSDPKPEADLDDPSQSPAYGSSLGYDTPSPNSPWGKHRCSYLNTLTNKLERPVTSEEVRDLLEVRGRMTKKKLEMRVAGAGENAVSQAAPDETSHPLQWEPQALPAIATGTRTRMGNVTDSAEALGGYQLFDELEKEDLTRGGTVSRESDSDGNIFTIEQVTEDQTSGSKDQRESSQQLDIDALMQDSGRKIMKRKSKDMLKSLRKKVFGGR